VPQTQTKPFHKAHEFKKIKKVIPRQVHVCFYAAPFGVIPLELDEVYPLSQHETALPLEQETIDYVANEVADYIKRTHYESVFLLNNLAYWNNHIKKACKRICLTKRICFQNIDLKAVQTKNILTRLEKSLKKKLSE